MSDVLPLPRITGYALISSPNCCQLSDDGRYLGTEISSAPSIPLLVITSCFTSIQKTTGSCVQMASNWNIDGTGAKRGRVGGACPPKLVAGWRFGFPLWVSRGCRCDGAMVGAGLGCQDGASWGQNAILPQGQTWDILALPSIRAQVHIHLMLSHWLVPGSLHLPLSCRALDPCHMGRLRNLGLSLLLRFLCLE